MGVVAHGSSPDHPASSRGIGTGRSPKPKRRPQGDTRLGAPPRNERWTSCLAVGWRAGSSVGQHWPLVANAELGVLRRPRAKAIVDVAGFQLGMMIISNHFSTSQHCGATLGLGVYVMSDRAECCPCVLRSRLTGVNPTEALHPGLERQTVQTLVPGNLHGFGHGMAP